MAISLYNPNTRVFSTYDPKANNQELSTEVLLLNILIELKVISEILSEENLGISDAPEQIRSGLVLD